jgi:predicted ATPase
MIHSIEFTDDWRCFKAGDRFEFRPGVNLMVGDQGCGKSSLFKAMKAAGIKDKFDGEGALREKVVMDCDQSTMYSYDFEKDNVRTKSYFGDNMMFQVGSMFASHGECNLVLINALETAADCLVLMDEPDTALSIRSCNVLVQRFREVAARSSQVIAAVHSLAVIQQFDEVLSLEHKKWMQSAEFIASHLETE